MILQSRGSNLLATILRDVRVQAFLNLKRDYFKETDLVIYDFIDKYYKKYSSLPSLDLTCKKTGLQKVDDNDVFGFFNEDFLNHTVYLKLADKFPQIQSLIADKKIDQAILQLEKLALESKKIKSDNIEGVVTLAELGSSVREHIEEAKINEGLIGVPSGFNSLDVATGGFKKGDLYLLAGRPKDGKSQILMLMADYAHLSGFIPMFVSMEMDLEQLGRRHYATRAKVGLNYIKTGMVSNVALIKIQSVENQIRNMHPFYYVRGAFTKNIDEIISNAYGLKPDIIYIDGGYLLKLLNSVSVKSRWEYMEAIAQSLKDMAMSLDVPVVVTFQFNREYTKTKVKGVEHLQLTDALGQLASLVIGIQKVNPDRFNDINIDPIRHLHALVGREGEDFKFDINWNFERMNFEERLYNDE